MAWTTSQSIQLLHDAVPETIAILKQVSEAIDKYLVDMTASAQLVDLMCDILEFADDAPIWRLLRRDAARSNTMDFVTEQLEAMPIGLECFR